MAQCIVDGRKGAQPCLTLAALLRAPGAGEAVRTAAVGGVMDTLRVRGGVLPRWYGELFPVASTFGAEPAFLLERGAYTMLGVRGGGCFGCAALLDLILVLCVCAGYGVHVSGYVEEPEEAESLKVWVAQRYSPPLPSMNTCAVWFGLELNIVLLLAGLLRSRRIRTCSTVWSAAGNRTG